MADKLSNNIVAKPEKENELSPNPAGSGFIKQLEVSSLPLSGEPNVLYLVPVYKGENKVSGYFKWRWNPVGVWERVADDNPIVELKNKQEAPNTQVVTPATEKGETHGDTAFFGKVTVNGYELGGEQDNGLQINHDIPGTMEKESLKTIIYKGKGYEAIQNVIVEISGDSGILTDAQYEKLLQDDAVLKADNQFYYKDVNSSTSLIFKAAPRQDLGNIVIDYYEITKSDKSYELKQSVIETGEYAKQDGAYENLWAGNLITDQNWRWVNDFEFGTGTVDTVFDGEATIYAIRGKTEWEELGGAVYPQYVNVVSNVSVIFNLFNPETHYAHVVESDDENNGLCIYGTGITTSSVVEFSTTSDFASITEIAITEETNSTGETYLHCSVPSDGFVRIKNAEPADLCISNVWGGNRVGHHPAYEQDRCDINSESYFGTGMKSIHVNGEEVVYDELFANKAISRVLEANFGVSPSLSYVDASGTFNIYRMSLSNALNKGACEIGGSSKFAWTDLGQMSSSSEISADCMSLYTGYIYFAIAQSEDTSYTYSEDSTVVDAETFASELADKGALFKLVDDEYVSVTEYEADTTYYYISATNVHGLNGQAIVDEIKNKYIVYEKSATETAISPAKDWSYHMGDFGTEELILANDYPVVPNWYVYYPINVLETVQQLPNNYVSAESFLASLNLIGETEGFKADGIEMNEETGNLEPYYFDGSNNKVKGVKDTKETIITFKTRFSTENSWVNITNADDIAILEKKWSLEEQARLSLIVFNLIQYDNFEKNQASTKAFYFGGQHNATDGGTLRAFNHYYYSANNTAAIVIQFQKSGSTWQYFRRRQYW